MQPLSTLDYPTSEIVIGLVYAVGTDDRPVQDAIEDHVKQFGYRLNVIRLSQFLWRFDTGVKPVTEPEAERINSHMDAGNAACRIAKRDDFLALAAVSEISKGRTCSACDRPLSDSVHEPGAGETHDPTPKPEDRTVHLLLSLKRPEEVMALRRIYGPGFYLMGVFATEEERMHHLRDRKSIPEAEARKLMKRDEEEDEPFGQRTRKTFALADVFVRLKSDKFEEQVAHFLDLMFGKLFETPTPDENAMFLAYAASARSSSPSRQVGAVVVTDGDVVGVGCNDVPCFDGGLYWPGERDQRDHKKGAVDSNDKRINEIIEDVVKRFAPAVAEDKRVEEGRARLSGSPLLDLTEYGRSVHAEMEALLACSRTGATPRGGTLYTTTFPCHNCTKHIVAAGIKRVVYVEPYPKSLAGELHSDAVAFETEEADKVTYQSFVGVGPRRYFDLFSMKLSSGYPMERKSKDGTIKEWERKYARPRVPMLPTSYLEREKLAVDEIEKTVKELEAGG